MKDVEILKKHCALENLGLKSSIRKEWEEAIIAAMREYAADKCAEQLKICSKYCNERDSDSISTNDILSSPPPDFD